MNVMITVLNCQKCDQRFKGHKSLGSLFHGVLSVSLSSLSSLSSIVLIVLIFLIVNIVLIHIVGLTFHKGQPSSSSSSSPSLYSFSSISSSSPISFHSNLQPPSVTGGKIDGAKNSTYKVL